MRRVPIATSGRLPSRSRSQCLPRRPGRHADDRNADRLVQPDSPGRKRRPVQHDGGGAGPYRLSGCDSGIRARGHEGGPSGDDAEAGLVEEVLELEHVAARFGFRAQARRSNPQREMAPRSDRSGERDAPVERQLETGTDDDANILNRAPHVDGADGQRARRPTGAPDAAVPGPGEPVVPRRSDDERVQAQGAGRRARSRTVHEGGERLADADERDPRGVMRAAVSVRIDRALEPGDQLVGAPVEAPRAACVLLPAGDPNRQKGRAGGHTCELGGPLGAGDDARELGAVALETRGVVGIGVGSGVAVTVDHVTTLDHLADEEGVVALDPRIEQRDGDTVSVEARQRHPQAVAGAGGHALPLDHLRRLRGGVRHADRVHARDLGHALEQPEHLWVDRRREPGDDA